jgi:iron complex transport system permease protein
MRKVAFALFAWAVAFALALGFGAVSGADLDTILSLRLPRALLASAVGAGLAVAGAALQTLFANPLCEPYTLGISSGAALGAVLGASLGLGLAFSGLAGSAFLGALLFAALLYFLSRRARITGTALLLSGVMLQFFGSSLVALWMGLTDAAGVQSALIWLLGDLSRARIQGALFTLGGVALLSVAIGARWRALDALLLGDEDAASLGVDMHKLRRQLILLVSFLVALCVSASGLIGFVGLVVPHFVRSFAGSLHRKVLPLSAIWGAFALTLADLIARGAARPFELPAGVVTALLGAPVFLWIMVRVPRATAVTGGTAP